MKKTLYIMVLIVLISFMLKGEIFLQTVSQIAYVIKTGLPTVETIAVVCSEANFDRVEAEAKSAVVITKKKIVVYKLQTKADIAAKINEISALSNVAVLIIADSSVLNKDSVKFIVQKVGMKKIPVISVREGDTQEGALLAIYKKGEEIEKHLNKKVMPILGINLAEDFIGSCIVDIE